MVLAALNIPDSVDTFGKFYRPLLAEINNGNITPAGKRGRGHLIHESDIQAYIDQLKRQEKEGKAFYFSKNNEFVDLYLEETDKDKVIDSIKALLTLHKNKLYSDEKTLKEIGELVKGF